MTEFDPAVQFADITAAHRALLAAELTEDQAREAIALPGWTRGHVLIHLADLSQAFARQARYAVKGERVEVYDGGRPTRDRRIEELHGQPVGRLTEQMTEGLTALEESWAALSEGDWELPCSYRNSPLWATRLAWWRESSLHLVDLDVGRRSEEWSAELSSHVVEFLGSRLPEGTRLEATDTGQVWGEGRTVRGELRALAAWISGRPAAELPRAVDGGELPELTAWP
ncbi:maleylpyruvate isomerase family mycothiol-dependent enzyme [Streptomyces sp. NPDC057682]|uniref:maleylpyruvate isomerase family mycothiol-dependent enzyme n=1 Tax=Streptomyces sp. NPDC057682 TaxID=3346210 RepID=UPI003699D675